MASKCFPETPSQFSDRFKTFRLARPRCQEKCAKDSQCVGFHWTNFLDQRLCVLLMFDTKSKSDNLETIYGEHEYSSPNVATNDTVLQEESFANFTRDLAQAKEGF